MRLACRYDFVKQQVASMEKTVEEWRAVIYSDNASFNNCIIIGEEEGAGPAESQKAAILINHI